MRFHVDHLVPRSIAHAIVYSAAVFSTSLALASTDCPKFFFDGKEPVITNQKLKTRSREVCFEAYAVMHSGISRTPIYSAEHLTRQNLELAKTLSRKDSFHAETRLPDDERAELSDYSRSGYDRGHMAPNADFPTRSSQAESFSLANMVPQVHSNNAGIWSGIEGAVRQLAIDEGDLYVVSGPAFLGSNIQKKGNVLVPTHIWKMVYSPQQRKAGAYLITNDETTEYSVLTVSNLEKLVGIQTLPAASQNIRDAAMQLPKPTSSHGRKKKKKRNENNQNEDEFILKEFSGIIKEIEKAVIKKMKE